jgi:polysaccharide pyruvyl transferase
MKIGIITTSYALNYGAVLQAYALQRYLDLSGYESEIIDYRPAKPVYGREMYFKNNTFKNVIKNSLIFTKPDYKRKHQEKVKVFDNFLENRLHLSRKKYYLQDDFNNLDCYDVFICGSDQIWNLNLMDDRIFFLPFKSECINSKYISYAPSIAENLSDEQLKTITDRIQHFDSISIREAQGAISLSRIMNKDITAVLDPVFLLNPDDWREVIPKNQMKKKYILCYFLGINETSLKLVNKLKQITGLDVINIGLDPKGLIKADIDMTNISPLEYVSMIESAEFVCTNSFHATAFSIIFNKKFYTIKHSTRNSRMDNLFNIFSIEGSIIESNDNVDTILENNINDKENVDYYKVQEHIEISKKFIKDSLLFDKL